MTWLITVYRWGGDGNFWNFGPVEKLTNFVQSGFNEADSIKSNSLLIYSNMGHIIYAQMGGTMPYQNIREY
jgi:hypothetical protein